MFLAVEDPRTGEISEAVELLAPDDVSAVAERAAAAFARWRAVPAAERCTHVLEIARLLEERTGALATVFSREHGKAVAEAATELSRAVATFRWYAVEGERLLGATPLPDLDGLDRRVEVDPAGPALIIVPWNFPAVVLARKLAPALVMGCPVVVKTPDGLPGLLAGLRGAVSDAGLPSNVVQFVDTSAEGAEALVRHPAFLTVSFTGSTAVGRAVAAAAAQNLTPCVLELGGHAPAVVTETADLDAAVAALTVAKFGSAGQSCAAPSRILVHHDVINAFTDRFVAALPTLDCLPGGTMGPLRNRAHQARVHDLVKDAVARGADCLAGGTVPVGPGAYYPPTVLVDVPLEARMLTEEPFAPVAPVVGFRDEDEAVWLANATPYGLSGYVFGALRQAERIAGRLDVGAVGVNCAVGAVPDAPLGGRHASGHGYEGGAEGMLAYGRLRTVTHRTGGAE